MSAPQSSERRDLERGGAQSEARVSFRDLVQDDLPVVKELHRALFPVQYSDTFYNRLFTDGYHCIVGIADGEIVAVASARCVEQNGDPSEEAYIMTLGVRVQPRYPEHALL